MLRPLWQWLSAVYLCHHSWRTRSHPQSFSRRSSCDWCKRVWSSVQQSGEVEVVLLQRRLYDLTDYPPLAAIFPNSLHLLPMSLCQHCSPADNRAWIKGDITLKRWLSPNVRNCVCVCEMDVIYVCVQDWLDSEGGGESGARIREPCESWVGADTTPPHQGLNLLRDQTHL